MHTAIGTVTSWLCQSRNFGQKLVKTSFDVFEVSVVVVGGASCAAGINGHMACGTDALAGDFWAGQRGSCWCWGGTRLFRCSWPAGTPIMGFLSISPLSLPPGQLRVANELCCYGSYRELIDLSWLSPNHLPYFSDFKLPGVCRISQKNASWRRKIYTKSEASNRHFILKGKLQ